MHNNDFDTLSQAINALTREGYKEDFIAGETKIYGSTSKKEYLPHEIEIIDIYRFDGMTNPQDDTTVFALITHDGLKGTLVMSNSSSHNHNVELIRAIPTS